MGNGSGSAAMRLWLQSPARVFVKIVELTERKDAIFFSLSLFFVPFHDYLAFSIMGIEFRRGKIARLRDGSTLNEPTRPSRRVGYCALAGSSYLQLE